MRFPNPFRSRPAEPILAEPYLAVPSRAAPGIAAGYPPRDRPLLHLALFALTFVTTTFAGASWAQRDLLYAQDAWFVFAPLGQPYLVGPTFLLDGLRFSVPLLLFLTAHEFGHYFAARRHGIAVSLPTYLPLPFLGFGTFGAVIRIREPIPTTRQLFDVGAAGPLAGMAVALVVLVYALATLPPPEYLMAMPGHEAEQAYIRAFGRFRETLPPGPDPLTFSTVPLYGLVAGFFPNVPPPWELYHYPTLLAAWLSLVFTALNLLPVGQLDGGHMLYALVGRMWHGRIARAVVLAMLLSGGVGFAVLAAAIAEGSDGAWGLPAAGWAVILWIGLAAFLHGQLRRIAPAAWVPALLLGFVVTIAAVVRLAPGVAEYGYWTWLIWAVLLTRLVGLDHPAVLYEEPLTPARRALGWLCVALFALTFTPRLVFGGGL